MKLEGGNNIYLNPTAIVEESVIANVVSGNIYVGAYSFIAYNVMLLTGSHDIYKYDEERQQTSPLDGQDITIGRGVWIASGAIILPCVIGDHAVIGAGSVVTNDVEPYEVVAGNPARHIKWAK